ncbi:SWIM zinc finger protein [Musa troglodytarum]|uniref:SWIM zinc finger protein n=1 Tax=Musa troglodytarum TaxID=320322 RepID=A0A9E7GPG2_9LILI|nr:SWIM zinc finger protein [Musa troglodytarum]URE15719.1 SWIM zinc finger protein [Musa troglodytarum]
MGHVGSIECWFRRIRESIRGLLGLRCDAVRVGHHRTTASERSERDRETTRRRATAAAGSERAFLLRMSLVLFVQSSSDTGSE